MDLLEAQDLHQVHDFVICDLGVRGITDVEELALEGEDAVDGAAYHGQAGYGQCLDRVPLGDDKDAVP